MPALSAARIGELLQPYFPDPPDTLLAQLSAYLDLLLKWNARTNLTAIRDPGQIVERHFGESLFLARHLPSAATTLLDFGSGAGFPGIPVQLARPDLHVTLAESQHKKAAFLREVVRTLALPTEVWGRRVEDLPSERRFDIVALRAVDNAIESLRLARLRVAPDGRIAHLGGPSPGAAIAIPIPNRTQSFLALTRSDPEHDTDE